LLETLTTLLELPEETKRKRGVLHTPREIAQQPDSWLRTVSHVEAQAPRLLEFLERAGVTAGGSTVFLVGAGTSDFVGCGLIHLLQRRWRCAVQAVPSTDLLTEASHLVLPHRPYLWISFSRSGDSPEAVAVMEQALARQPEVSHLVITCNHRGRMATQFSGHPNVATLILDDEVNDRGLAMTSSFSNMVIAAQALAHLPQLNVYMPVLQALVEGARRFLPVAAAAAQAAAGKRFRRVCFLGSGPLHAVARESALKVLELTAGRIDTLAQSFLGLRHGPMSALDATTLVVGYLAADPYRQQYERDLLVELRRKGLHHALLVVAPEGTEDVTHPGTEVLFLNLGKGAIPDDCRPPLDVLFGQLLGLFSSLALGLPPDAPSPNGAISRVVSHFKIFSNEGTRGPAGSAGAEAWQGAKP